MPGGSPEAPLLAVEVKLGLALLPQTCVAERAVAFICGKPAYFSKAASSAAGLHLRNTPSSPAVDSLAPFSAEGLVAGACAHKVAGTPLGVGPRVSIRLGRPPEGL